MNEQQDEVMIELLSSMGVTSMEELDERSAEVLDNVTRAMDFLDKRAKKDEELGKETNYKLANLSEEQKMEFFDSLIEDMKAPVEPVPFSDYTDDELAIRRDEIRQEISSLKRSDEVLKAERDDIDAEFKARFAQRGSSATRAGGFTISAKEDDKYPDLYDRQAFEAYVLRTGNLFLLQSRLMLSAIQEEIAAGKSVPGVRLVKKVTINQRKRD